MSIEAGKFVLFVLLLGIDGPVADTRAGILRRILFGLMLCEKLKSNFPFSGGYEIGGIGLRKSLLCWVSFLGSIEESHIFSASKHNMSTSQHIRVNH